ncbi:hypothetical protein DFH11DRAFT_882542 [Phellopilus nigrolimitatus]|nr:hypothetical protein DFH11DRAFT_882542 [Phellopilus nigrolimitatus]
MTTTSPQKRPLPIPDEHNKRGSLQSRPFPSTNHGNFPYAVKTTSNGVLTRSNSSGQTASPQHSYVPTTPSPSSKRHFTKSDLAQSSPRPLPIPPSLESPQKERRERHGYSSSEDFRFPSHRTRRADTLPSAPTPPPSSPVKVDDLPSNPRVWTTSQLASYLITALRVRSGEVLPLPLPVAKDVAAFVKEARLNGRAFLRLNEQDLESMGINNLWREALLNASRNLRQNVLKGRIWGFDSDDAGESAPNSPYSKLLYNSSSSSIDDVFGSQEITPDNKGTNRKGRVRGLVASLERTSSSGSGLSNHGSSTSEGDLYSIPGAWADDEAAFASGSEASDVEDHKTRATTKRRIIREPVVPPMEIVHEVTVGTEAASPEAEPSVEELLTASSHNWGAKAWEDIDMNAGETVKHISPENTCESQSADAEYFAHPESSSRNGSGKGISSGTIGDANAKVHIKDIFSRPLPSRPLPTPPKSGASSPTPSSPSKLAAVLLKPVAKREQGVQVDSEPESHDPVQQNSGESGEEAENLKRLVAFFTARLAEVEKKLDDLERREAEQERNTHQSQAVETDATPSSLPSTESRSVQAGCTELPENIAPILDSTSVQVKNTADLQGTPSPFTLASQPSGSPIIDPDDPCPEPCETPPARKREWRQVFTSVEWDPLESGIPSYVLMVGVGVCAVVLSTLLKRLAGKKP